MSAELSVYLRSVLMHCLDIRTVWSVDRADGVPESPGKLHELVIFANAATLHVLRKSDRLHRADVMALVVFDGEQFENGWGPERISGSLARWGWRQQEADLAYYDEAKWQGADGAVVRSRRRAVRVWSSGIARNPLVSEMIGRIAGVRV